MLVEINLLPKKERKNRGILLIILITFFLCILCGILYFWQYQSNQSQLNALEQEYEAVAQTIEMEQQRIVTQEDSNSVNQLMEKVKWADQYPIKSVPLLRHLIGFLPERGFMESFSYTEDGAIKLEVRFDKAEEAAFYLKELSSTEVITNAMITSLEAAPEDEGTEETEDSSTAQLNYEPRYTGTFELILNLSEVKKLKADGELPAEKEVISE